MASLELILILIAAAIVLQLVAVRIRVPLPALLVVGGGILAAVPGLPRVQFDPGLIFLIFVPPLLYDGAQSVSWREMRARARPILSLGVGLVLFTMLAVAVVAHAIIPSLSWPAAFALGAIVSPPDPVAAGAVLRPLGVSRTVQTILEGEGLVNDAASLIAYRVAVAAALSGSFSLGTAALDILLAGAGGIVIGLAIGWLVLWLGRHLDHIPVVLNSMSLLIPFAAYIPADRVGASGVLSVVAAGLYLAHASPRAWPAAVRIQHESTWALVSFLLESLIFIFVGLEMPAVFHHLGSYPRAAVLDDIAIVSLVCIIVRLVWAFPSAAFTRRRDRARYNVWPEVLFIGWAGVRGADSLVIALALPLALSGRPLIIIITFGVIIMTLVLQGFTFAPAVRLLGLGGSGRQRDDEEEIRAWIATTDAGLARLDVLAREPSARTPGAAEAIQRLRDQYTRRRRYWSKRSAAATRDVSVPGLVSEQRYARQMLDEAQTALIDQRDRGEIDDAVARHVERYLDLQALLLDYHDWDVTESPFEVLPDPPADD